MEQLQQLHNDARQRLRDALAGSRRSAVDPFRSQAQANPPQLRRGPADNAASLANGMDNSLAAARESLSSMRAMLAHRRVGFVDPPALHSPQPPPPSSSNPCSSRLTRRSASAPRPRSNDPSPAATPGLDPFPPAFPEQFSFLPNRSTLTARSQPAAAPPPTSIPQAPLSFESLFTSPLSIFSDVPIPHPFQFGSSLAAPAGTRAPPHTSLAAPAGTSAPPHTSQNPSRSAAAANTSGRATRATAEAGSSGCAVPPVLATLRPPGNITSSPAAHIPDNDDRPPIKLRRRGILASSPVTRVPDDDDDRPSIKLRHRGILASSPGTRVPDDDDDRPPIKLRHRGILTSSPATRVPDDDDDDDDDDRPPIKLRRRGILASSPATRVPDDNDDSEDDDCMPEAICYAARRLRHAGTSGSSGVPPASPAPSPPTAARRPRLRARRTSDSARLRRSRDEEEEEEDAEAEEEEEEVVVHVAISGLGAAARSSRSGPALRPLAPKPAIRKLRVPRAEVIDLTADDD